ncbi:unnamed protein product [Leptosia nina]|uniref:BAG domain-containing protein n=1 Tax=Leptosia nina TaxID=320188 RepID=A0AAV1JG90_9NEOP
MESPVVVDKPPEYHGNERGFPFDEEEGSGPWSDLAARHPDIAARLRQRPATWARKRRPSSQDTTDDFGDSFSGFDRFPFDDIPPEFREHFPSHWNRRFSSREDQPTSPTYQRPPSPQQQTAATQTDSKAGPPEQEEQQIPQYGLRNTVDLGQKSPADPSLVDAEDRTHRSMSAPPDNRTGNHANKMSGQQHPDHFPQHEPSSNVRHIPIFVEGRDEPVINKRMDHGTHFGDSKPSYVPPPQPHIDREQYFADDTPHGFHHPPNFSRSFGTPFNKGFRQGPQPFTQQKMYPQNAFARGASPQRSQSPKPQAQPEEHFVKVPVYHEQTAPPPSKPQAKQPSPQRATQPPPRQQSPQQQSPQTSPQPKQPSLNDPITQILSIQSDVLNLMTEVENFSGTKKDKQYIYLDEMLTRNLIKLDNIETEGKENIRQARREAIKCIQKCIAVLEAKAAKSNTTPQPQDAEMPTADEKAAEQEAVQNGDVEMQEPQKSEQESESQIEQAQPQQSELQENKPLKAEEEKLMETEAIKTESAPEKSESTKKLTPSKSQSETMEAQTVEPVQPEIPQSQVKDTRPIDGTIPEPETKTDTPEKKSPKKVTKVIKKRDKSKDKTVKDEKETANKETAKDNKDAEIVNKDSNKQEPIEKNETHLADSKGNGDSMEVDGAASQ